MAAEETEDAQSQIPGLEPLLYPPHPPSPKKLGSTVLDPRARAFRAALAFYRGGHCDFDRGGPGCSR